jgi:hypothetical protein
VLVGGTAGIYSCTQTTIRGSTLIHSMSSRAIAQNLAPNAVLGAVKVEYCQGGVQLLSSVIAGLTVQNCVTYGVWGWADFNEYRDCVFSGNGYDLDTPHANRLVNCVLGSNLEIQTYNSAGLPPWALTESVDHDQQAGALRTWSRGGIVSSVANVCAPGRSRSYQHVLESAVCPCFWCRRITLEPGRTLRVRAWFRKDLSMAYLPRVQIVPGVVDEATGGTPLVEAQMTDSTGVWEILGVAYTNAATAPVELVVRCVAMNASGNVWSDMELGIGELHGSWLSVG